MGRWQGRLAWCLCVVALLGGGVQVILLTSSGVPVLTRETFLNGFPVVTLAALAGAVVGALIVSRYPRHPIGWNFTLAGFGSAMGLAAGAYGVHVLRVGDLGPPWAGQLAVWTAGLLGSGYALPLLAMLFLLVPDGRLPSRRWWPALALPVLGLALHAATTMSVAPGRVDADYQVAGELSAVTVALNVASNVTILLALPVAGVALVRRLRAARGEQRQQLRWIATSAAGIVGGAAFVTVTALLSQGRAPWYAGVPLFLAYASVPVCTGIAILRYRLYDIDIIINRAFVLAVLATFLTVGYIAVVVLIGAVVGRRVEGRFWPSLLAIAVVALAFQPVRGRVLRWADRLVYGERAAPYEALADFSRRIGDTASPDALLPLFAEAAARSVGARRARVHLDVPGTRQLSAGWPDGADAGDQPGVEFVLAERGESVGVLTVLMPPGRVLRRDEHRLLEGFARQAELALRNARLDAQLRARVAQARAQSEALEASRRRLLDARDAERQRVASTINRTVLARLEPLLPALEAGWQADPPGPVAVLRRLDATTDATLDALREITRGLFPTVLSRRGLVAALRAHLGSIRGADVLLAPPEMEHGRFPSATETAAYFCCVAALADLSGPADLRLDLRDGLLVVDVRGPAGECPAAQRHEAWYTEPAVLTDRVEAAGGRVRRDRRLDGTIVLHAELPVAAGPPGD